MIPTPLVHRQLAGSHPFWLISNLSFETLKIANHLRRFIESRNQGIRHVHIKSGTHLDSVLQMSGWGIIPVFEPGANDQIQLFFNEIYQARQPLLTMYVDLSTMNQMDEFADGFNPDVRFGKLITKERLREFSDGLELMSFVQSKLKFFEEAQQSYNLRKPIVDHQKFENACMWPLVQTELDQLEKSNCCIQIRGKFKLYLTKFNDLVHIPREVGRLRALTFEAIGEGSGQPIDLDDFDHTYYQLFLVDIEAKQIAGGYRIGPCDQIIPRYGVDGLYTHSLYKIDEKIVSTLEQSIELGRSFVVTSYQKHALPLFLLWNGILKFIHDRPQYKYIIGMVSISRVYSDVSRSLIISYLQRHHFNADIATFFQARQEYFSTSAVDKLETVISVFNGELIRLDEFIAEIEPENYRLPVLIRKYINQNAQFIGFNLDPDFSNCIDGLMLLDIDKLPISTIQLFQAK
jgi:hypothetical protein